MKPTTLAEFKAWVHARQMAVANAIPDAPAAELRSFYTEFSRTRTVIDEIEKFTDSLEKDEP